MTHEGVSVLADVVMYIVGPLIGILYFNLKTTLTRQGIDTVKLKKAINDTLVTHHEHEKDIVGVYKSLSDHKDFNKQNFDIIINLIKSKQDKH